MKYVFLIFVAAVSSVSSLGVEPMPTDRPNRSMQTDRLVEGVVCESDPTQTYTLYLPPSYDPVDLEQTWPVLLIFDPRGRSVMAAELFIDAAREYGWILMSSDNTRSDTGWEPNQKALEAMWPELALRYTVDPRRIYATGFSGGAIAAYYLSRATGGLAGIIGVGGRWPQGMSSEDLDFAHFGIVGNTDFNYHEMREIEAMFAEQKIVHRLEVFDGPHRWMGPDLAREAVEWMEILAIRSGYRDRDPALEARLFGKDVGRAEQLEAEQRWLSALRRYRAIRSTFHGLVDLDSVQSKIVGLEGDVRVAEAQAIETRWDDFFARYWSHNLPSLSLLKDRSRALSTKEMVARLEVRDLLNRAEKDSYEGVVAQRILRTVFTQSGFYLSRELAAEGRYREAVIALEVALAIHDERWRTWYDMACYAAQGGERKKALKALSRAVELGFDDLDAMTRDARLDSLRKSKAYRGLVDRLGGDPK